MKHPATTEQSSAFLLYAQHGQAADPQGKEPLFGVPRIALVLEGDVELFRHDWRHRIWLRDPSKGKQAPKITWPIERFTSLVLVEETGLLAQRAAKDDGCVVARKPQETADKPVHLPVPGQDGGFELLLLLGRSLHPERLRLHVAPIHVLQ